MDQVVTKFRWFGVFIALVLAVDLVAVVVHDDDTGAEVLATDHESRDDDEDEARPADDDPETVDDQDVTSTPAEPTTSTTTPGSSTSTSTSTSVASRRSTSTSSSSTTTSTSTSTTTTTTAPAPCPDVAPKAMSRPTTPGLYVADDDGDDLRLIVPDGSGSVSPDGRTVVFVQARSARICVGPVAGGPSRSIGVSGPLTSVNRGELARWSPDSERFVLLASRSSAAALPADVVVVHAATGAATTVSPGGPKHFFSVDWSPDGRHLGVADDQRLVVMRTDGTDANVVHDAGERLLDVQWNPDGTSLLTRGASGVLRDVPRAGGAVLTLDQRGLSFDWDDDDRIAIEAPSDQADGESALMVVGPSGAEQSLGASGHQPRWTGSGRVIALVFDIGDSSTQLISVAGDGGDVRVLFSQSPQGSTGLVLRPAVALPSAGLLVLPVQELQSLPRSG